MSSSVVERGSDSLIINWKYVSLPAAVACNYEWSRFAYIWLRENCQCPKCYDLNVYERLIKTTQIPQLVSKCSEVSFDAGKSALLIVWEDGHESLFSAKWLVENTYEHNEIELPTKGMFSSVTCSDRTIEPVVFSKDLGIDPPAVDYSDLLESDSTYIEWSDHFERYGFCFIENCPLEVEAQRKLVDRLGSLQRPYWADYYEFGGEEKDEFRGNKDSAFTSAKLEVHTDGGMFDNTPGIQLLHVHKFEGSVWAENNLVDGVRLVEMIQKENPYHFRILSSVPLSYIYSDNFMRYVSSHVPIVLDERGNFVRLCLRYTNLLPYDEKAFIALKKVNPEATMSDLYAAMNTFFKWMNDESAKFRFVLKPGTIMTSDNFRMMHGRTPYKGKRLIRGFYTNIDDWRAVLRHLRIKLKEEKADTKNIK